MADAETRYWPLISSGDNGSPGPGELLLKLGSSLGVAFWPQSALEQSSGMEGGAQWRRDEGWVADVSPLRGDVEYPFSLADLAQAVVLPSDASAAAAWLAALDALDAGAPVRGTVIGGSMTYGIQSCCSMTYGIQCCCPEGPRCAWPSKLEAWLHLIRPRWNVSVLNYGMGGTYDGWLTMLIEPADIFMIDTSVNMRQASAAAGRVYDALLWRLLHMTAPALSGPPALLCLSTLANFDDTDIVEREAEVARYYGLATASYRHAIGWADASSRPSAAERHFFWADNSKPMGEYGTHPREITHELMSDVVKYAFLRLLSRRSSGGSSAHLSLPRAGGRPPMTGYKSVGRTCASEPGGPLTALSPRLGFAPATPPAPGWRLYEDRPRKPGWIADAAVTKGGIVFDVAFGAQPRLEIAFLLSYVGMGAFNASLAIGPCTHSYLVNASYDPHWTVRYSITQVA